MNKNIINEDGTPLTPGTGISLTQLKPIPGETPESFEAFVCYFHQGSSRSLKQVAQKMEFNLSTVKDWSAKYNWVNRILEYTASLFEQCVMSQTQGARQELLAKTEREQQQLERCLSLADLCSSLGENLIKHILLTAPEKIKPADAIRLIELGDKLRQSARAGINLEDLQNADAQALRANLMEAATWLEEQKKRAAQTLPAANTLPQGASVASAAHPQKQGQL